MSKTGSGGRQDETRVAGSQDQDSLSRPVREVDNISGRSVHLTIRHGETEIEELSNLPSSQMLRFTASHLPSFKPINTEGDFKLLLDRLVAAEKTQ